jgi:hypothetical protein
VRERNVATDDKLLLVASLAHAGSMFATSFVEEEHQTVYYTVSTLHMVQVMQAVRDKHWGRAACSVALMTCARLLRSFNQVRKIACVILETRPPVEIPHGLRTR